MARLSDILAAPIGMTVSTKPARATPSTRSGGKVEAREDSSRYHPGLVGPDSRLAPLSKIPLRNFGLG